MPFKIDWTTIAANLHLPEKSYICGDAFDDLKKIDDEKTIYSLFRSSHIIIYTVSWHGMRQ